MTRTIIAGTFVLALACDAAAQPASDAGWIECLKTPARACVLREAAEVASGIADQPLAASELGEIAKARLKAGLSAATEMTAERALANSIADDRFRDEALERLAQLQAQADMLTDALKTTASIQNSYLQAEALGAIAVAEGKAGRLEEALRRVQAIEDLPRSADILRRVAWDIRDSAVARGDDDKIVAALDGVQAVEEQYHLRSRPMTGYVHASEFFPALAIIAQTQARAGKLADAMRVARLVTGSIQRAQAFTAIAVALARAGAVGSALQVARSLDDRCERGVVLGQILEPRPTPDIIADESAPSGSSVKAEVPDKMRDFVAAFTDREQRATVLCVIATALANNGHWAEAAELVEPIDQGKPRAFAWHAIAKAQAKAGLAMESIASFDRAVQGALSFEPHDWLLSKIAISQAEAGQIDDALRVTQLIGGTMATAGYLAEIVIDGKPVNTDHDRRMALRAIARAQARAGRLAEALQNARALVLGPDIIPPELGVVAEGLAEDE